MVFFVLACVVFVVAFCVVAVVSERHTPLVGIGGLLLLLALGEYTFH